MAAVVYLMLKKIVYSVVEGWLLTLIPQTIILNGKGKILLSLFMVITHHSFHKTHILGSV
jgi:hypothetical protein